MSGIFPIGFFDENLNDAIRDIPMTKYANKTVDKAIVIHEQMIGYSGAQNFIHSKEMLNTFVAESRIWC